MKHCKFRVIIILAVFFGGLVACTSDDVHKTESKSNTIRIYDVEPQEDESVVCVQHYIRVGVLNHIGNSNESKIPFANQIEAIEAETGVDIEYVVVGSWEELREEQEKFQDANVTEIILFNNTYDESIIKEATSGRYANMESALKEYGFYDEKGYNQIVLNAGMLENGQVLVPILYNVSGMIHGDDEKYAYEDWRDMAYEHVENASIDFEEFITMLKDAMATADVDAMEIPFLSGAFLEDKVDLFLMAAGGTWEGYQNQEELFKTLYEYLKIYQRTQIDSKNGIESNQTLYINHIKDNQRIIGFGADGMPARMTSEIADDLKIEVPDASIQITDLFLYELVTSLLDRTEYFVECTAADDIAFHSVYSTLAYRNYYVVKHFSSNQAVGSDFQVFTSGNMEYWPIGVWGAETEYAAQPICYAAVVEGGNTRLAAKVLQSMMNQETDVKYGISVCNASKEKQVNTWLNAFDDVGKIRKITVSKDGQENVRIESNGYSYWGWFLSDRQPGYFEDKQIYAEQIGKQIDNIVLAQIPDRELLGIWQDTLIETVDSGISVDEGFELLCDRMEAWFE